MFRGEYGKKNAIFLFIVLAGFMIYYYFYSLPSATMQFSVEDYTVTFTGAKNTSSVFRLTDITELSFVEDMDYGECTEGGTGFGNKIYGLWKNDRLGVYQAYANAGSSFCIVIKDPEKTAVFNYETSDTTRSIYEELEKYRKEAET